MHWNLLFALFVVALLTAEASNAKGKSMTKENSRTKGKVFMKGKSRTFEEPKFYSSNDVEDEWKAFKIKYGNGSISSMHCRPMCCQKSANLLELVDFTISL